MDFCRSLCRASGMISNGISENRLSSDYRSIDISAVIFRLSFASSIVAAACLASLLQLSFVSAFQLLSHFQLSSQRGQLLSRWLFLSALSASRLIDTDSQTLAISFTLFISDSFLAFSELLVLPLSDFSFWPTGQPASRQLSALLLSYLIFSFLLRDIFLCRISDFFACFHFFCRYWHFLHSLLADISSLLLIR